MRDSEDAAGALTVTELTRRVVPTGRQSEMFHPEQQRRQSQSDPSAAGRGVEAQSRRRGTACRNLCPLHSNKRSLAVSHSERLDVWMWPRL